MDLISLLARPSVFRSEECSIVVWKTFHLAAVRTYAKRELSAGSNLLREGVLVFRKIFLSAREVDSEKLKIITFVGRNPPYLAFFDGNDK